ncbi:MAG: hypothetical protein U0746_16105 [Gemmataceae bacterium]
MRRRASAKTAARPTSDPRRDLRAALDAGDFACAADAAIALGKDGREALPERFVAGFDAVRSAFSHYEAGHDEEARAALDAIGLGSPFLDWKLLLRGLLAYSAKEDARALENWSRLKPERLPARLIAPLRAALDTDYLATQSADAQVQLRAAADKLVGGPLPRLREVQRAMGRGARLAVAFRHAEPLVNALRQTYPEVVPRLANVFLNAIVAGGEPDDVIRFRGLFGPPADDPGLERLEAEALEQCGQWADANDLWKKFTDTLAKNSAWPEADRTRARAIVYVRMGVNAAEHGDDDSNPFLRPRRFNPPADACFRKAVALAPDLVGGHAGLFKLLMDNADWVSARAAGAALLSQFPDHVATLKSMAEVSVTLGDAEAALDYARRAVEVNPLDRNLRIRLATAHRVHARAGDAAAARADLAAAAVLFDSTPAYDFLAQRWAVEKKAKDAAADMYEQQAIASAPHRLAAVLAFVAEGARLKLPKPAKKPFDDEFAEALATPNPTGVAALLDAWYEQEAAGDYYGAKTHYKKILDAAKKSAATGDESGVNRLCSVLAARGLWKPLLDVVRAAKPRFPKNAWLLLREAQVHIGQDAQYGRGPWKARPLLDRAKRLTKDPAALALHAELEAKIRELSPFGQFDSIFDSFFGGPGDET